MGQRERNGIDIRKSKEAIKKAKNAERVNKWQQANAKKINIMFNISTNEDDKKAFEWLQKQPNKSGCIKSLILKEINK